MKWFKKKIISKVKTNETDIQESDIHYDYLHPGDVKPISQSSNYRDFLLSHILKSHDCYAWGIEPIFVYDFDKRCQKYDYGFFLGGLGPNKNYILPNRIILPSEREAEPDRCSESYFILESSLADDLRLRYYNDKSNPVWVAATIKGNEVWLV